MLACPITAEEAWSALAALARCGALDLLVTSLSALFTMPGQFNAGYSPRSLSRLRLALRGRCTTVLVTNVPCPSRTGYQTVGGQAIAQAAALRIALEPLGPIIAPYGDIAGLRTTVRVAKHHGLPHGPTLPLELTAQGPRRAAELLTLGRLAGCVEERQLGLTADGQMIGRSPAQAIRTAWSVLPLQAAGNAR